MSVHGTSGPLHTEPHDLAPISERVRESFVDQGLPYHADMFSTGETPHGCGDVPRTVHQGIRTTAADFITKGYRRENITIRTEVFSQDSEDLTATGVATISKNGKKIDYQARKEVIVAAGAYCSPPILMRSGLGSKEQLEKHGIECLVDLPGVGGNLMDHIVSGINEPQPHAIYLLTTANTTTALLHLLRSLGTKPNKRLPRLPRQRHRVNLRPVPRKENRHPLHLSLWHIRLRPPRRAPR
jgi:choline dehydrogenase-like flavoprotein